MSVLFNHARRYDLYDRNPIQWVRQSAKRRNAPDVLTSNEVKQLLAALQPRERIMVLLDVATGLRQSELFALKWKDVDFKNKQLWVTRSIVQQIVGRCKTEASQKPVPLHDHLIRNLRSWQRRTPYRTPESWVFASPQNRGQKPYWGTRASSSSHPPGRAGSGHHEADWLAHFPQNLFHLAPRYWSGVEGYAGTDATFNNPRHPGYLHPSCRD
jgi:integrase